MDNAITFEGAIQGWVANFLKKHFWRVKRTMSYEDVMQEAYAEYLELRTKWYPHVTEPKHFMSLFKLSWSTHFTDLASRDSSSTMCTSLNVPIGDEEVTKLEDVVPGDIDTGAYTISTLRALPEELQELILIILNAPSELITLARESLGWSDLRQRNLEKKLRKETLDSILHDIEHSSGDATRLHALLAAKNLLDSLPEDVELAGAIRGLAAYLAPLRV